MKIVIFGDIFGKPGRKAVAAALPAIKERHNPDFVLGNAENLAGGRGVNRKTYQEMIDMGFDAMTGGNHTWDNKEVYQILETDHRLLRPANYPSPNTSPCPGKGFAVIRKGDKALFLVNLMGRVFMDAIDCPFLAVDKILHENRENLPVIVDMHADATSEKYAMGWHLAGRVSSVTGTHSHVQTADERLLPGGTAYITDIGMSGSFDSVIGLGKEEIIRKFITKRPQHYQTARENPGVGYVVITIGDNRKASTIERFRHGVQLDLAAEKELE